MDGSQKGGERERNTSESPMLFQSALRTANREACCLFGFLFFAFVFSLFRLPVLPYGEQVDVVKGTHTDMLAGRLTMTSVLSRSTPRLPTAAMSISEEDMKLCFELFDKTGSGACSEWRR